MATDIFRYAEAQYFGAISDVRVTVNRAQQCWVLSLRVLEGIPPTWLAGLSVALVDERTPLSYDCTAVWIDTESSLLTAHLGCATSGVRLPSPEACESDVLTPFSIVRLKSPSGMARDYRNAASQRRFLSR